MEKALGHLKAKNVPGNFEEGKRCLRDFEKKEHTLKVGLYKLNPVYPQLESAWFQPLNLSSEKPVSKFAFKCNLYRYITAKAATNLSFLYFQEGDVENAATYADLSVHNDRYDGGGCTS
jgi:hypothetical protein